MPLSKDTDADVSRRIGRYVDALVAKNIPADRLGRDVAMLEESRKQTQLLTEILAELQRLNDNRERASND